MPSTLLKITMEMCYGCDALMCVICKAVTPPTENTSGQNMFARITTAFRIYVPDESVDAYKAASSWSTYANRILGKSSLPEEYKKYWP